MADKATIKRLERVALSIREDLLELCNRTAIHIGGDYSAADLMTVIWQYAMKYDVTNPRWEERDRFVLSKGHAAAVTSLNQAAKGCYKKEEIFNEYATDFGRFGMHSCNLINPYVDVSTGSLGHGLPVAVGIASGLKVKKSNSRVFVVMGDGEMDEGSIWEGAMAARHFKLGNLIGFVDRNRLSLDGKTEEIMALEPFVDKWKAFGWNVVEVDGNNMEALVDVVDSLPAPDSDVPTVVIANTTKGNGVSFMENVTEWHSSMIDDEKMKQAQEELEAAFIKKWGEL
ncbi:transketolase [Anaerolentibacter hominis]|uniref:transketolase n=1 Tax=Anaerolentibacter hominis TaxID=3079009 RepID=UPI0031B85384